MNTSLAVTVTNWSRHHKVMLGHTAFVQLCAYNPSLDSTIPAGIHSDRGWSDQSVDADRSLMNVSEQPGLERQREDLAWRSRVEGLHISSNSHNPKPCCQTPTPVNYRDKQCCLVRCFEDRFTQFRTHTSLAGGHFRFQRLSDELQNCRRSSAGDDAYSANKAACSALLLHRYAET